MKRRLAVIFMADMVDYSRLMEADQANAIALVRELREQRLEPEAARRGGEVLKRLGDGWIIAFTSVADAVDAARAVQAGLAGHPSIQLRIAVHLGEIAEEDGDFYGTGINIAARLQTEAPPGGVMVSQDLHRQLDARLAGEFADAGTFELKNIAQPVTGYQWRPAATDAAQIDDVPVIGVEPVAAVPDRQDTREAAVDLQEQLVHRLSRRTGIRVLALDDEGEGAGAPTYLLRGRLRASGSAAKITLSLILRETGRVAWSEVFEGTAEDLFELADRVAGRADSALRIEINAHDGERLAALPDEALSASELRTRAAQAFYTATTAGYERAIALLDRALRLAPDNPMSLAMWAHGQTRLVCARFGKPDPELVAEIVARSDAAVAAAPRSDFICNTRAEVRVNLQGDIAGARRALARVVQINPSYSLLKFTEFSLASAEGSYDAASRAMAEMIATSAQDPFRPMWFYMAAVAELLADRPEQARRLIEEAIELRPACRGYLVLLAEILALLGEEAAEVEAREQAAHLPAVPDVGAANLPLPKADRGLMAKLAPDVR